MRTLDGRSNIVEIFAYPPTDRPTQSSIELCLTVLYRDLAEYPIARNRYHSMHA